MASRETQAQRFAPQRADGSRHIQAFASRRDNRLGCAMDLTQSQVGYDQGPVDGWVGSNTQDHVRKANASSSVGWAVVPPKARVERAPHITAKRKEVFKSQRFR